MVIIGERARRLALEEFKICYFYKYGDIWSFDLARVLYYVRWAEFGSKQFLITLARGESQ